MITTPPLTPAVDLPAADAHGVLEGDTRRVLVVDDEESIRVALSRFLRSRGYDVAAASTGDEALAAIGEERCALVLCDVRMPGMSGVDLLPALLARDPEVAIVMLSAVNDAHTAAEAISRGAADYLVKPVELGDLQAAVDRALRRRSLLRERRRVERFVREEVVIRTAELEREKSALRELTVAIAETLINAMEVKEVFLRGHSQRVAALAASIASELVLDVDAVESVRLAGRLHDIGKIGIREEVLNKPGPLTDEETAHVRDHVRIGVEILSPLTHLGAVIEYVHDHHERFDGSGYPRGRRGEAITLGGRILAAADAFDAITSPRAWRAPLSPGEAIQLLESAAGSHLDPQVFGALRNCVLRRRSLTFIE
ncbi:MAG TPA: HD domain-containing phosphohydrolase [Gemmatimonadaceae bacterium]|nr:HD domain-containing phosphohydrolase [Gemmatimonadaceae bacterium]